LTPKFRGDTSEHPGTPDTWCTGFTKARQYTELIHRVIHITITHEVAQSIAAAEWCYMFFFLRPSPLPLLRMSTIASSRLNRLEPLTVPSYFPPICTDAIPETPPITSETQSENLEIFQETPNIFAKRPHISKLPIKSSK